MKPLLAFLLLSTSLAFAQTPDLTLARDKNWLVIQGPHLPKGEIRINYLEAYCRTNSTTADWHDTTIGQTTELLSLSDDKKTMKLRCTVKDGVIVDHTITASADDVTFAITAHNPTATASGAHWAQPCIRLSDFTGYDNKGKDIDDYLPKCFLFLDGKLTRMGDIKPWIKEARYIPGQVWCPKDVPRTDVNPRPLSPLVPSNGLIGCFSGDEKQLFAVAFEPYQELFQGVARCLHSDFRIGGLKPGETKHIKGKIYILPNDVPALLTRYAKDFPNIGGGKRAILKMPAKAGPTDVPVTLPKPPVSTQAAEASGFERRGFYLHGSWVMEHPFAVRSWSREDMAGMFRLLRYLGFNHVMVWPTPETAPMPLSDEDAATLRSYRGVIDDAHAAGLKLWLAYCPTVISTDAVRGLPWADRSLYATTREVRLTDAATEQAYLKHRGAVLRLLDNADAFVVIDGDPGGYAGAPMEEYLRILASDQRAVPGKPIIPMIWSGWGRETKGGFWQAPVAPLVEKCYAALQEAMSGDWEILPGRSHREGWANGRTTIALAEKAGLMSRATLMCYEAIEFEPTPPAAVLQFDLIRNALRQESQYAGVAKGVFGNSQQPVMVLPNLYYFARAAADLRYLDRAQDDVLADLARELGGDPAVLVPAWSCLQLPLEKLSADLAEKVRAQKLDTDFARCIPGGPQRYVEIIAAQVQSRRQLLQAMAQPPGTAEEAAASLADGAAALIRWWQVHRYVGPGKKGDPFGWQFLRPEQVGILKAHAGLCRKFGSAPFDLAAQKIADEKILSLDDATKRLTELSPPKP